MQKENYENYENFYENEKRTSVISKKKDFLFLFSGPRKRQLGKPASIVVNRCQSVNSGNKTGTDGLFPLIY